MIKVIANESFAGYYEVYDGTERIDEVQGRAKAKRVAVKLAKKAGSAFISFLGQMIDVE